MVIESVARTLARSSLPTDCGLNYVLKGGGCNMGHCGNSGPPFHWATLLHMRMDYATHVSTHVFALAPPTWAKFMSVRWLLFAPIHGLSQVRSSMNAWFFAGKHTGGCAHHEFITLTRHVWFKLFPLLQAPGARDATGDRRMLLEGSGAASTKP